MTRKCAYLLWLAALTIGGAPQASAQTAGTGGSLSSSPSAEEGTGLNVSIVKAGGVDFSEQKRGGTPIGLPACVQGSIEVTITGLPNSPQFPYLEVWYSTGTGACNQADRATRIGSNQNCTKLSHSRDSVQINSFSVLNTVVQIQPVCDLNSDQSSGSRQGPQTLWFLLLRSQGSAEVAQFYRAFTINIDTLPPDKPFNVSAGSGQTDILVNWELPVSSTNFYVLADFSEGALVDDQDAGVVEGRSELEPNCESRYLREGNRLDPAARPNGLLVRETNSISTEMSFDGRDFDGAKRVPVAVAAEDLAGNISVLSAVKCMTVTQTTGFWDRYKSPEGNNPEGGAAEPGCACSAPGARSTSSPRILFATPLALLLVGAYARRRIRRRAR